MTILRKNEAGENAFNVALLQQLRECVAHAVNLLPEGSQDQGKLENMELTFAEAFVVYNCFPPSQKHNSGFYGSRRIESLRGKLITLYTQTGAFTNRVDAVAHVKEIENAVLQWAASEHGEQHAQATLTRRENKGQRPG